MARSFYLDVLRPGKTVRVRMQVEEILGEQETLDFQVKAATHHLDEDELADQDTLLAYLARITRTLEDGGHTTVVLLEDDLDPLLDLLGCDGWPDHPVEVELPADG